ncbi:FG-GAP-like repeat-containing protein [Streptomyces sp. NBC_00572]|uniref:FG-GAP-like repeat-containing protein n=1 Tax=Streptomyces sp. NBC_00572 TaxID=2903664 RepID=UPI00224F5FEC|nr:FG-GAP-like repeat-containing protein [Streptomyces sp. NBC_00572]MCX4982666.1 FG-GAP-like repeat-containing protein [Streptomyces sp. NBC_00572]
MRRPIALVAGLAAAAALLLGIPTGGTAAATPRAAQIPSDTAPYTDEVRVITWNICGEAGGLRGDLGYCPYRNDPGLKMDEVAKLVTAHRANVVMLQEACGYQGSTPPPGAERSHMALLATRLGTGWSFAHAAGNRAKDYVQGTSGPLNAESECRGTALGGKVGVLLAVKGTFDGPVERIETVPAALSERRLPLLCARVTGRTDTFCTTHLIDSDATVAQRQSETIRDHLQGALATGVVLGGDLNNRETTAALAPIATTLDRCENGDDTFVRWENDKTERRWSRLDHLFGTQRPDGQRFVSCVVDHSLLDTTHNLTTGAEPPNGYSDHAPVIGYRRPAPVPGDMTGDGAPDLVAVDADGKLRLYHGEGTGGIPGAHDVIGTGGWYSASVAHRGDWTGDGREDVLARVGGELRVYANRGGGALAAPVTVATGLPTDAKVVGVGDTTHDGHPDAVLQYDDRLWLHAGVRGSAPAVAAPRLIGDGGWDTMTLTSPGDADRDGRADLLARDTGNGDLWLYRGSDDGTFGNRVPYGYGYGVTARPLLAGGADADRNGVADLWATTNEGTGTLLFYAGGTGDTGTPVDGARTTVGLSSWNTIRSIS